MDPHQALKLFLDLSSCEHPDVQQSVLTALDHLTRKGELIVTFLTLSKEENKRLIVESGKLTHLRKIYEKCQDPIKKLVEKFFSHFGTSHLAQFTF